jgi:hypothetical protein
MGTPAVITFKGTGSHSETLEFHVGRNMDGDPVTVFQGLAAIVQRADKLIEEFEAEFGDVRPSLPSMLAGLYIGEATMVYGMQAHILKFSDDWFAEWRYNVDTDAKTIEVIYNEETAVDPAIYLERLRDDCVESHRLALDGAIGALAGHGFTVEKAF